MLLWKQWIPRKYACVYLDLEIYNLQDINIRIVWFKHLFCWKGAVKPALNLEYGCMITSIYNYDMLLLTEFLTMIWSVMSDHTT